MIRILQEELRFLDSKQGSKLEKSAAKHLLIREVLPHGSQGLYRGYIGVI